MSRACRGEIGENENVSTMVKAPRSPSASALLRRPHPAAAAAAEWLSAGCEVAECARADVRCSRVCCPVQSATQGHRNAPGQYQSEFSQISVTALHTHKWIKHTHIRTALHARTHTLARLQFLTLDFDKLPNGSFDT